MLRAPDPRPAETDDWQVVIHLCESVRNEVPAIVPGIVARIRTGSPAYATVPRDDHERHVSAQFCELLDGLAGRRPPTAHQVELARDLGRQRGRQGVPVEEMIAAYHVGYREMWNVLLARTEEGHPELTVRLVRLVDLVWTWIRVISSASADAHGQVMRSRHAARATLEHRFLEELRGGEASTDEALSLARALGFEPGGEFQAVCFPGPGDERLDRLRQRLDGATGSTGSGAVVLVQAASGAAPVVVAIRETLSDSPIGVGLCRRGLDGAAASIVDAERALAVAERDGTVVEFSTAWLLATLSPQRHRLTPLLRVGRQVARSHPHLASAVLGFAEHGFSVTAAARKLHLHPNTVKYRLDRWEQLTGWDPRGYDGLVSSLLSLGLFPAASEREP